MHKLFYFLLVILPYVPVNGDKELPLVQFYDVVKNLKTTLVAGRSCDTTSWTGTDGTKYVTLKTPNLNNDGTVCKSMYDYLNQQGAVKGATWDCKAEADLIVLNLIGVPDPTYDPSAPPPPKQPPLVDLGNLLGKYPKADLGGCPCCPVVSKTNDVQNIEIFCYLAVNKTYTEVCDDILTYLNQNHWLDDSSHECKTHYPSFFSLNLKGNY